MTLDMLDLPEIDGVDVTSAYHALNMLTCPWRLRIGICETGCHSEPACETGATEAGWANELREAVGQAPPSPDCPANHGSQCCGYPHMCRRALAAVDLG